MVTIKAEPESVGMSSERLARIAPVMESYVNERGVVGISTLVSRRGEVVHAERFGHQDREAGVPMSDDTIFRIYSMTKPVVSTALMMLHEEAVFQLEHPVMNHLPAFKDTKVLTADGQLVDQNRPMDVRDVLTHTSGLTYDFMANNPVAALYREVGLIDEATGRSPRSWMCWPSSAGLSARRAVALQLSGSRAARLVEVFRTTPG